LLPRYDSVIASEDFFPILQGIHVNALIILKKDEQLFR
jgi:hypothetical protein